MRSSRRLVVDQRRQLFMTEIVIGKTCDEALKCQRDDCDAFEIAAGEVRQYVTEDAIKSAIKTTERNEG